MSAAKRSFGLFLIGVLLAAVVAGGGVFFGSISRSAQDTEATRAQLSAEQSLLTPEMKDLISSSITTEDRIVTLSQALHAGTIDSLQLFWPHFLNEIPDYERDIEPQVRYHALHALALKFERSDWENWVEVSGKSQVEISTARTFVDDISVINPSLGRFLETSAYLLHKLYLATINGKPFDEGVALQNLIQNSDMILSRRRISALPASLQVDTEILKDAQFQAVFEGVRGKLIASYIDQKSSDLANQINLILSLDPNHLFPKASTAVEHVLYRIILQTDGVQRIALLGPWEKLEQLKVFLAERNIRQALARLYLTVAIDKMEQGNKSEAKQLYAEATALGAHLSFHYTVGDFIETGVVSVPAKGVSTPSFEGVSAKAQAGGLLFGTGEESNIAALEAGVETVGEATVSALFFVIVAVFGGISLLIIFFIFRRILAVKDVSEFDIVEPISGPEAMIDPSKIKGFPSPAELKKKRVNS